MFFVTNGFQFVLKSKLWRCGYAETDITPKPGKAFMTEFGKERYDRGMLAPLRAQVIALEDLRASAH